MKSDLKTKNRRKRRAHVHPHIETLIFLKEETYIQMQLLKLIINIMILIDDSCCQ